MALGSNHLTITTQAYFIPELWSDELIAAYKANIVLSNLVTKMNHTGKKGDTVHIPLGTRGSATVKAANTQITAIAESGTEVSVAIDKHYEYSRVIEDIVAKQALSQYRKFYMDDAGYALGKQVDQDLWIKCLTLNGGSIDASSTFDSSVLGVIGGDGSTAFDGDANTNIGNATHLSDTGLRTMIQTLDDADNPVSDRCLVIPPVEKKILTGIARFTEQAFTGEAGKANTIRNGYVGEIYGIPVYVSSAALWVHLDAADGEEYVTASSATPSGTDLVGNAVTVGTPGAKHRTGVLMHRGALVHVEQMAVRMQTQYKLEYLADLMTADTIYGVKEIRDTAGVSFIVPSA